MSTDMQNRRDRLEHALGVLREKAADPNIEGIPEAATKSVLIEPLLAAMGFESLVDIEWEYLVKASNERIDYVLKVHHRPTVAVEAKSFRTELTDKHGAQLVQYAAIEGIEWCLLTNGRQLRVYNASLKGALSEKHVVDVDLLADDPGDAVDVLSLLSKEGLTWPDTLKDWMRRAVLDRALRLIALDADSPAVKQLAGAVSSTTGFDVTPEHVSRWFARILSPAPTPAPPAPEPAPKPRDTLSYWLLPAGRAPDEAPPIESLRRWLGAGMWGMGRSTPGRKWMLQGDFVCFYATGVGVAAWATLASAADELVTTDEWPEPTPMEGEVFKVPLKGIEWLPQPIAVDERLRSHLEAFQGKKPSPVWSWFVQTTRKLSERDFRLLVGGS